MVTVHNFYDHYFVLWRARRTIGCRGGNRNWNGVGEKVGGEGALKNKLEKTYKR